MAVWFGLVLIFIFRFSMQLIIRDIPAKSRIETQVKLQIELAECISPSNPHGANLVQRWPWIRVPITPSVKHRTREPPGMPILYLSSITRGPHQDGAHSSTPRNMRTHPSHQAVY